MVKAPVIHSPDQQEQYQLLNKKQNQFSMATDITTTATTPTTSTPLLSQHQQQSPPATATVAQSTTPQSTTSLNKNNNLATGKEVGSSLIPSPAPIILSSSTSTTSVTVAATTVSIPSINNTSSLTSNATIAVVVPTTRSVVSAVVVGAGGGGVPHKNVNVAVAGATPMASIKLNGQISVQVTAPPPTPPSGNSHHPAMQHAPRIPHHFQHLSQFPVPPPGGGGGPWPIVEPVFHFGPGFEPQTRHYCPQHSQGPQPSEHVVFFHVNPGVSVSFQVGASREIVRGPVTVPMVSQSGTPPMAMPVQVPHGHVMQQIVDENGTLRHVILSTAQPQQMQGGVGVQNVQPHLQFIGNGQTPHYFPHIAAGYPPGGHGQHYHPIPSGHMPHQPMTHSSHSPSPPNSSYHKDERSQRQHNKLLRKFEQKQREVTTNSSTLSTPAHSPSPRKTALSTEMNGVKRMSVPRNGASSVGTSEDGEESSSVPDEEDDVQVLIDQLSDIQSPEISEITSRTAFLQWTPPTVSFEKGFNPKDLVYEVFLSDRGKEGKYKSIFKGDSLTCLVEDLKPSQEYYVCLQAILEHLKGTPSEATVFSTPPCEPDQPDIAKLVTKTKTTLQLRWNAPNHNGGPSIVYILEHDDGKTTGAIETKAKQYTIPKLLPSTTYKFRLAAKNDYGTSTYSKEFYHSTLGNPPSQPQAPTLENVTSSSIRLSWIRHTKDEDFTLQIKETESTYGFQAAYNGVDTVYECVGLRRATIFVFRLRANNTNGSSPWSDEVTFKTLPERPSRPLKPQVKGKIHAHNFKAKWDVPADRGGAEIEEYHLELSSGAGYERIYSGSATETMCDRLNPGTTYQVKLMCEGPGGTSQFSEPLTVTTEAVVPDAPAPPFCTNPPGPYAAVLRWEAPDYNGGAPVTEYEIEIEGGVPVVRRLAYRGKDTYCVIKDLLPGESYKIQLRASNRIGYGPLSEEYTFRAGAASPNAPSTPTIVARSPTHLTISWQEPMDNGAEITEYYLESSVTDADNSYTAVYQGNQPVAEIRNLSPFTTYFFRICATNVAGTSPFSETVSIKTSAAPPNPPSIESFETTSSYIFLQWSEPESNGSDILFYNIDFGGERLISTADHTTTEYFIKNLQPETQYKIKLQAVNEIGLSAFSLAKKLTTNPLPPAPPKLECYGIGFNFLKVKWGEKNAKNLDFKRFHLEMFNSRSKEFQVIYSGTSYTFKVNKLQEMTSYTFRICAETDYAGQGDYSEDCVFKTCAALPANIKAPRLMVDNWAAANVSAVSVASNNGEHEEEIGDSRNSITIEWQHSKNSFADPIEYALHFTKLKKDEFKEIYRGHETRYTIYNLQPGVEYQMKVCPIRILHNDESLMGTFSPILRHTISDALGCDSVDGGVSGHSSSGYHSHASDASGNSSGIAGSNLIHSNMVLTRGGTVKRIFGNLSTIYTSRDKWTDKEKACFYSLFFIIIPIIFAAFVKNFIR